MAHPLSDRDYAQLLKAVADETRLGILRLLAERDRSVGEIARMLGLSVARVSHHLAILRSERLVLDRRVGKHIICALPALDDLLEPGRTIGWGESAFEVATLLTTLVERRDKAPARSGEISVYAASDLRYAFSELAEAFERRAAVRVRLRFGATGQLAEALRSEGGADLIATASRSVLEGLAVERLVDPASIRSFAFGRLVVWRRSGVLPLLRSVRDLAGPEVRWLAIAHPDHAPNGAAAAQLLRRSGLWSELQPKLWFGNDTAQALQFADTDNGAAAIVPLALSPGAQGHYTLIPEQDHPRIEHALAATPQATAEAEAFGSFVGGPAGRMVLKKYGLKTVPCAEEAP